ncbi:hypothetical protein PVAP13_7NG429600 [Panicum virgatum]|uniref:Dirigent protein n=1 Tax=Panicum virgatum TaxID=38727 RepID=A0A8T0QAC5_PANVG|nr:hypothetical protein PVAP13_7NG429600 [Panicum virgatum]
MAAARCSPVVLMLLLLACCVAGASAADEVLTHLHFYFHEVEAGAPNATVVNVASLHRNASTFGDLNVFDNALREGPDPASRLVGRAQGIGVHASLDESGGLTAIVFAFSDYGEYSGSTLATLGHLTVSGPGRLRFARGYMTNSLVSSKGSSIVVVFDMYFTLAH